MKMIENIKTSIRAWFIVIVLLSSLAYGQVYIKVIDWCGANPDTSDGWLMCLDTTSKIYLASNTPDTIFIHMVFFEDKRQHVYKRKTLFTIDGGRVVE